MQSKCLAPRKCSISVSYYFSGHMNRDQYRLFDCQPCITKTPSGARLGPFNDHLTQHCVSFKEDSNALDKYLWSTYCAPSTCCTVVSASLSFVYFYVCGQPASHTWNEQCRSNIFIIEDLSLSLGFTHVAMNK